MIAILLANPDTTTSLAIRWADQQHILISVGSLDFVDEQHRLVHGITVDYNIARSNYVMRGGQLVKTHPSTKSPY